MRVGPKGQVVIPASLRQALKIGPGSEIVFRLEKDKVIIDIPKIEDPVQMLESIALKGKSIARIDHDSYRDEIESRHE